MLLSLQLLFLISVMLSPPLIKCLTMATRALQKVLLSPTLDLPSSVALQQTLEGECTIHFPGLICYGQL